MNGWTMAEAAEAEFGRFRLIISGVDIRGFYGREQAEAAVFRWRCQGYAAHVRDGNPRQAAVENEEM